MAMRGWIDFPPSRRTPRAKSDIPWEFRLALFSVSMLMFMLLIPAIIAFCLFVWAFILPH